MSEQNKVAPLVPAKDATATLAGTGGAILTALGTNPTMAPWQVALIAGFVALMPGVLAAGSEAFVTRKRRDAQRFWDTVTQQWAKSEDKTPEEIAGVLESRKDEPYVNETIWRSIRALMEAADDAAIIPLGVLAQEYLRESKRPDPFFRGTVRLLQELSSVEMAEIHTMMSHFLAITRRPERVVRARLPDLAEPSDRYILEIDGDAGGTRLFPDALSDPHRLFTLLERDQLSRPDYQNAFGGRVLGTMIDRAIAERLHAILSLR